LNVGGDWNDSNWSGFNGSTSRDGTETVTGGVSLPNLKAVYVGGNINGIPSGTTITGPSGSGNATIFSVQGQMNMQVLGNNQTNRFQNLEFHVGGGDLAASFSSPSAWLSGNAVYITYNGHARFGGGGGTVGSPLNAPQIYEMRHMTALDPGKYYGIYASGKDDQINFNCSPQNPVEIFGLIMKNWFNVNDRDAVVPGDHTLDPGAMNWNNPFMRRLAQLIDPDGTGLGSGLCPHNPCPAICTEHVPCTCSPEVVCSLPTKCVGTCRPCIAVGCESGCPDTCLGRNFTYEGNPFTSFDHPLGTCPPCVICAYALPSTPGSCPVFPTCDECYPSNCTMIVKIVSNNNSHFGKTDVAAGDVVIRKNEIGFR